MLTSSLPPSRRQLSLDILRGVAVLGILVMNIQAFSMVVAAYANPTAYGDLTGPNLAAWLFSHLFAEQKFVTLFALLFGAGIVLIAEREAAQGRAPFVLHARRMLWLMLFGLLHGYLLWYGDILFSYAICGLLVYAGWRQTPRRLYVLGTLCILLPSLLLLWEGLTLGPADPEALLRFWQPTAEQVAEETRDYQGSWLQQMEQRVPLMTLLILSLPLEAGWRISGLMLIGMGLYKSGVLSARRPPAEYRRLALLTLLPGLALILIGVVRNFEHDWAPAYSIFFGSQYNYWGSLAVAFGYLALVMLWCHSRRLPALQSGLAAAGRLALSNYLLQTLICTTLFYGHGLGWFGQLQRWQLLLVVTAIWLLQIAASVAWTRRFRYGPFEWLWRRLARAGLAG